MPFLDTISDQRSTRLAVYGVICIFMLSILSLLSVNIFDYHLVFTGLPVIGLFLWPRLADSLVSVIGLFFVGLWMDLIGEAALGYWPFILLFLFAVLRPERREGGKGLWRLWLGFMGVAVMTVGLMIGVALVFAGGRPSVIAVVLDWIPIIAIFPLIYWIYRAVGRASSDSSGGGFVL